jgi:hypothetical protein
MAPEELTSKKKESVPYYTYAFHNVYNYTLLAGVMSASALTQNWWLAVCGLGAEALWMVFGPDSKLLRRFVFDRMHAEKLAEQAKAERERTLAGLADDDRLRIERLEQKRDHILRLCQDNRSLPIELLQEELTKVDQLTRSFIDLVISARRFSEYLKLVQYNQLEQGLRRYESISKNSEDPEQRQLAQKNLDVLLRRKEKLTEINHYVQKAYGQMELIENTFRLLADQIVTMRSPRELGSQLDDLLDGVEAVKSTARETDVLLQAEG